METLVLHVGVDVVALLARAVERAALAEGWFTAAEIAELNAFAEASRHMLARTIE